MQLYKFVYSHLEKFIKSLQYYKHQTKYFRQAMWISLVMSVINCLGFYFVSTALGGNVPAIYFLLFVPIVNIISHVPVTHAGLGVREGIFVYIFTQLGLSEPQALGTSLLFYATILLMGALQGGVYYLINIFGAPGAVNQRMNVIWIEYGQFKASQTGDKPKPVRFGVIGFGYWGPNVTRNLILIKETEVKTICDLNPATLQRAADFYPAVGLTQDPEEVFNEPEIDVVAVITPVSTHFPLAKRALECGKHVFVEKPFTFNVKQAEELITLAEEKGLTIMVDHTFLFTGAVRHIKKEIDADNVGQIYYYDSTRVNLGLFQQDVNVIWDLAPHDFSILDFLITKKPLKLSALGIDHFDRGNENIAYVTIYFEDNLIAHFNFNWLSPVKVRNTLIGGSKKMVVWDDMLRDEKIKIYDKGVDVNSKEGLYRSLIDYRLGDMYSPRIDPSEALKQELIYFVECLQQGKTPINDGHAGLRIVRLLEAADTSLKRGGKVIEIT